MPKDITIVYWGFGSEEVSFQDVHAMLVRRDLRHEAWLWDTCGAGHIRLPKNDPRVEGLIEELEILGIEHGKREERRYTQHERDMAEWLWVSSSTGMVGTAHRTKWDTTGACTNCGSGCHAIEPLTVEVDRINKGGFMVTSPWNHIIAREDIADAVTNTGFTGVRARPVSRVNKKQLSTKLLWLEVTYTWPRVSSRSALIPRDLCEHCFRAGFSDSLSDPPLVLDFAEMPESAPDFGVTYEQFGQWKYNDPLRGSTPRVIISQRVRRMLRDYGVRIQLDPVTFNGRLCSD